MNRGMTVPQSLSNATLGMSIVLFVEIMYFCGLISAYVVLRGQAESWPPAGQPRLPIWTTALISVLLITSGVTFIRSPRTLLQGAPTASIRLVRMTFLLGLGFLLLQGWEWASLIGYGLTTASSLYGSLFYTLIGSHALHVMAGLAAMGFVLHRWRHVTEAHAPISGAFVAVRMYWVFVVAIWPLLYAVVYLW